MNSRPKKKKYSREEAIAWSREGSDPPSVLAWGEDFIALRGTEAAKGRDIEVSTQLNIGDVIIFVDSNYVEHDALVTKVWKGCGGGSADGCNLVFVSGDETKDDPYGRQIERRTSIVHISMQPAKASCWRRKDG